MCHAGTLASNVVQLAEDAAGPDAACPEEAVLLQQWLGVQLGAWLGPVWVV